MTFDRIMGAAITLSSVICGVYAYMLGFTGIAATFSIPALLGLALLFP